MLGIVGVGGTVVPFSFLTSATIFLYEQREQYEQSEQYEQREQYEQSEQYEQREQYEQSEQYEQREQSEQSEQYEQYEQSEQSEQREQSEQSEQSEQREQSEQYEQYEQFLQFRQFLRLSSAACAASTEPKYSTEQRLPFASVSHVGVLLIASSLLFFDADEKRDALGIA